MSGTDTFFHSYPVFPLLLKPQPFEPYAILPGCFPSLCPPCTGIEQQPSVTIKMEHPFPKDDVLFLTDLSFTLQVYCGRHMEGGWCGPVAGPSCAGCRAAHGCSLLMTVWNDSPKEAEAMGPRVIELTGLHADARGRVRVRVEIQQPVSNIKLQLTSPPLPLSMHITALVIHGRKLFQRNFQLTILNSFRANWSKPLFGSRLPLPGTAAAATGSVCDSFEYITQGDVVNRILVLSRFILSMMPTVSPATPALIIMHNCPEFFVAQFVCMHMGWVAHIAAPQLAAGDASPLNNLIRQRGIRVVFADYPTALSLQQLQQPQQLDMCIVLDPIGICPPPPTPPPVAAICRFMSESGMYAPSRLNAHDALAQLFSATAEDGVGAFVFFTSGSTGRPKAMLRSLDDKGTNPMQHLLRANDIKYLNSTMLAFAPLSHLAEYVTTHQFMIYGSKMCFPLYSYTLGDHRRPAFARDIIGDLKACRVTELNTVPRILDMIMELFEGEVAEAMAKSGARTDLEQLECYTAVRQRYRDGLVFGPQLSVVTWGSAPIQQRTKDWVYNVWGGCDNFVLAEGYGSSEGGTITSDEKVADSVVCFVVDAPDFGFSLDNGQGQVVAHSLEVGSFCARCSMSTPPVHHWLCLHCITGYQFIHGLNRVSVPTMMVRGKAAFASSRVNHSSLLKTCAKFPSPKISLEFSVLKMKMAMTFRLRWRAAGTARWKRVTI
jgi:acyl-CoA synthetase (AMP-forming)/AMP-acid ligase II